MVINSVKEQFVKFNLIERRELLDELLRLQELDGLVLQEAAVEVEKQRNIKPCPHCGTEKVYRRVLIGDTRYLVRWSTTWLKSLVKL